MKSSKKRFLIWWEFKPPLPLRARCFYIKLNFWQELLVLKNRLVSHKVRVKFIAGMWGFFFVFFWKWLIVWINDYGFLAFLEMVPIIMSLIASTMIVWFGSSFGRWWCLAWNFPSRLTSPANYGNFGIVTACQLRRRKADGGPEMLL